MRFLILLLFASIAQADTTITWSFPSQREDGSLLHWYEIQGYELWVDGIRMKTTTDLPYYAWTATLPLAPGEHTINMLTEDTEGRQGKFSPDKIIHVLSDPNPPGNVTCE